jgi:hypothetical protein
VALRSRTVKLSPAGVAGSATATRDLGVGGPCRLAAVGIDYTGMPATTDVTISNGGRDVAALDNANADAVVQPREQARDTATGAVIAGVFVEPVLNGTVNVAVAGADAGTDSVVVTLYLEEG